MKTLADAINADTKATAVSLKGAGANVVYVEAMNGWTLKPKELAVDCFHPSAAGQVTIDNYVKAALATPL
ncbi:MAG: hypothetical protein H7318_19450 [Oligoflexus sp.]|nr:hypothetical protein [Oligoflexus sp.]